MPNFFISYHRTDKVWAEWIASTLEGAGYSTLIQSWDMLPGSNFVLEMQRAAAASERTIAVYSPEYFASVFTQPEWAAAFARDPTGERRTFVPVRVAPCEPPGLLRAIVYCDLVGLDAEAAKAALVTAVRTPSTRVPAIEPAFPGAASGVATTGQSAFQPPGDIVSIVTTLLDLLQTTRVTFVAQARLRDELYDAMTRRLRVKKVLEYERFFARYYSEMNHEERHIHTIMRGYTENVLAEYNGQIHKLLVDHPILGQEIRGVAALKSHLIIWLAKFKGTFAASPWMALLYVGVEENVPFPHGVEHNLTQYRDQRLRN